MQFDIVRRFAVLLRPVVNIKEANAAQCNRDRMGQPLRVLPRCAEFSYQPLSKVPNVCGQRLILNALSIRNFGDHGCIGIIRVLEHEMEIAV
jgi:hypothetical protein